MLTEKDYCDYDTSLDLGELGFPLKRMKVKNFIDGQFSDSIVTVLLYEAQKWLREKKHLHIEVRWYGNMWYEYEVKEAEGKVIAEGCAFPTYEEALRTAVYMATEHLKGK